MDFLGPNIGQRSRTASKVTTGFEGAGGVRGVYVTAAGAATYFFDLPFAGMTRLSYAFEEPAGGAQAIAGTTTVQIAAFNAEVPVLLLDTTWGALTLPTFGGWAHPIVAETIRLGITFPVGQLADARLRAALFASAF